MPAIGGTRPPRVDLHAPDLPARADVAKLGDAAEQKLLDIVRDLAPVKGTGQENVGGGNVEVVQRRAALSVLMSRLSEAVLRKRLPQRGGKVLKTIEADLAWLKQAERG